MARKAVVLLSGGLDSAVALYAAIDKGYLCHCLTFDYGQRHKKEIEMARRLARITGSGFKTVRLRFPWKGSSLLDKHARLPLDRSLKEIKRAVPSTYVPARNSIFLSMAVSFAEAICSDAVFIGAHFEDSSGYPDCRKEYLETFSRLVEIGTKRGIEKKLRLEFPLIDKNKTEIIKLGLSLGVPFQFTWSCYKGNERPCMRCDSCILRANGFREAGIRDPLLEEF